jgi:nucleoside-diphosphate-sugar epimerase
VRPFNCYGPRQSNHFVVPTFCLSAIRDKKIIVRGNTKREFIYVKDNVRAIKALLDKDATGLVQIAQGFNYTIGDIANRIAKIADCPVEYGLDYRETDIQELLGSPASLLAHLPDFKFTSLEEGLSETYAYYKGLA